MWEGLEGAPCLRFGKGKPGRRMHRCCGSRTGAARQGREQGARVMHGFGGKRTTGGRCRLLLPVAWRSAPAAFFSALEVRDGPAGLTRPRGRRGRRDKRREKASGRPRARPGSSGPPRAGRQGRGVAALYVASADCCAWLKRRATRATARRQRRGSLSPAPAPRAAARARASASARG